MVIRENETSSIKSKSIAGILKAFDKESITIEDTETEITSVWQRSDIAQIKLSLDF